MFHLLDPFHYLHSARQSNFLFPHSYQFKGSCFNILETLNRTDCVASNFKPYFAKPAPKYIAFFSSHYRNGAMVSPTEEWEGYLRLDIPDEGKASGYIDLYREVYSAQPSELLRLILNDIDLSRGKAVEAQLGELLNSIGNDVDQSQDDANGEDGIPGISRSGQGEPHVNENAACPWGEFNGNDPRGLPDLNMDDHQNFHQSSPYQSPAPLFDPAAQTVTGNLPYSTTPPSQSRDVNYPDTPEYAASAGPCQPRDPMKHRRDNGAEFATPTMPRILPSHGTSVTEDARGNPGSGYGTQTTLSQNNMQHRSTSSQPQNPRRLPHRITLRLGTRVRELTLVRSNTIGKAPRGACYEVTGVSDAPARSSRRRCR